MWIWTKIGQSGDYRALKLSKVGTIVARFGPKLSKVDTRSPNRAKWALSGVDVVQGWIWTPYRMVKVDDSSILSTKSKGPQDNLHPQGERLDQA